MTPGLDSLVSLVRDTQSASVGRQALLVRLDRLPPPLRHPRHQRLARAALDPLLDADRGRLHELPAGRVAVSWRGEAAVNLGRVMAALGHLLLDGPAETPSLGTLAKVFQLPQDGPELLEAAREGADLREPTHPIPSRPEAETAPLDAAALARVEAALVHADVERFARRRPVCALGTSGLALAWEERLLDLGEIAAALSPGRSLTADPWLFRRLARTLDRRVLALLATPGFLDQAHPFGLRLGAESLISREFLRFDAGLPRRLRGQVIVSVAPADVLSDPAGFAFARDFVRARGYRVLLRGVEAMLLRVLALPRLDLDFVRVTWSFAVPGSLSELGGARLVLGNVDEKAALGWARAQGIPFVEGRAAQPTT
ncbi:MAG: hypothetical protein JO157_14545 [Acetobacteraceae bacterium]|nr:hypothetical protein [Acetobacteraceae bacterium]